MPGWIFKFFHRDDWQSFDNGGVFHVSDDDRRGGFIPLSNTERVHGTLGKDFTDTKTVIPVYLHGSGSDDEPKQELSCGGEQFPHIHARRRLTQRNGAQITAVRNAENAFNAPESFPDSL